MSSRKTCPLFIWDFLDRYREYSFGSRAKLAEQMSKDWNEDWTKEDLDKMFASTSIPAVDRVAKVWWSLGLKEGFPHPREFEIKSDESK